jgi:hypothetical protein
MIITRSKKEVENQKSMFDIELKIKVKEVVRSSLFNDYVTLEISYKGLGGKVIEETVYDLDTGTDLTVSQSVLIEGV